MTAALPVLLDLLPRADARAFVVGIKSVLESWTDLFKSLCDGAGES